MTTREELEAALAELEAEESSEETDDGSTASGKPRESSVIRGLRADLKRRDREAKAQEARAAKAEEELAVRVQAENARVLGGAGLSPRQQEAFLRMYDGAVTAENVVDFQRDVLGATPAPAGEQREEFRPTGAAGAASGGEKPPTVEDLRTISQRDPAEALALLRSGKVQFRQ